MDRSTITRSTCPRRWGVIDTGGEYVVLDDRKTVFPRAYSAYSEASQAANQAVERLKGRSMPPLGLLGS